MTTRVPAGTSDDAIQDVRDREAVRSRELAAQGHLLRLWRPPLLPGEWRTIGLFAAGDDAELETVLASMPLRVWRHDEVVPLSPHPNDPHARATDGPELLTTFVVTIPAGAGAAEVAEVTAGEAVRTHVLGEEGPLRRLWMLPPAPGSWRALGLWHADDAHQVAELVASLPMSRWMTADTTPLSEHPSDPARRS